MSKPAVVLLCLTLANLLTAALLLLAILLTLRAIASFAAFVSAWPIMILLPLGLAFSLSAIPISRRVESKRWLGIESVVNGGLLGLYLFTLVQIGWVILTVISRGG